MLDIVEQSGGLVVAMENCTGLKPLLEDVDETAADPLRALAENYFHLPCSVMTPNDRRLDVLRQLAADYRPECVVELIWQACLTYDVESHRIKRFAEDGIGLAVSCTSRPTTRLPIPPASRFAWKPCWKRCVPATCQCSRHTPCARRPMNHPRQDRCKRHTECACYVGPLVPPEWIAAHGLRPQRLRLRPAADRSLLAVSRGVCPYVGALIDGILGAQIGTVRFSAALVLTTVCDQMRYAAALLKSRTDGPIFLLNVPSTWQTAAARELYRAELRRLGRFLVQLGGKSPDQR